MASNEVLEAKLDSLISKLDEFLERYDKDVEDNNEAHKSIRKELYGNGDNSGGIKYQVMMNSKFRSNISKFVWILTGSLIANLIGLLFLLIKMKVV